MKTISSMIEFLEKGHKVVTRNGKRFYASGPHEGKEVGTVRGKGRKQMPEGKMGGKEEESQFHGHAEDYHHAVSKNEGHEEIAKKLGMDHEHLKGLHDESQKEAFQHAKDSDGDHNTYKDKYKELMHGKISEHKKGEVKEKETASKDKLKEELMAAVDAGDWEKINSLKDQILGEDNSKPKEESKKEKKEKKEPKPKDKKESKKKEGREDEINRLKDETLSHMDKWGGKKPGGTGNEEYESNSKKNAERAKKLDELTEGRTKEPEYKPSKEKKEEPKDKNTMISEALTRLTDNNYDGMRWGKKAADKIKSGKATPEDFEEWGDIAEDHNHHGLAAMLRADEKADVVSLGHAVEKKEKVDTGEDETDYTYGSERDGALAVQYLAGNMKPEEWDAEIKEDTKIGYNPTRDIINSLTYLESNGLQGSKLYGTLSKVVADNKKHFEKNITSFVDGHVEKYEDYTAKDKNPGKFIAESDDPAEAVHDHISGIYTSMGNSAIESAKKISEMGSALGIKTKEITAEKASESGYSQKWQDSIYDKYNKTYDTKSAVRGSHSLILDQLNYNQFSEYNKTGKLPKTKKVQSAVGKVNQIKNDHVNAQIDVLEHAKEYSKLKHISPQIDSQIEKLRGTLIAQKEGVNKSYSPIPTLKKSTALDDAIVNHHKGMMW